MNGDNSQPQLNPVPQPRSNKTILIVLGISVLLSWFLIRPGVFTVQPIGALPDGVTFVYYGRNSAMPFFASPDGMCIEAQGGVSLLCRGTMLSAASDLIDRKLMVLPYSEWAYLQSTGGQQFDR